MPFFASPRRLRESAYLIYVARAKRRLEQITLLWCDGDMWPGGEQTFIDEEVLPLAEELFDPLPCDLRLRLHDTMVDEVYDITERMNIKLWCLSLVTLHQSMRVLDLTEYSLCMEEWLMKYVMQFDRLESLSIRADIPNFNLPALLKNNANTLRYLYVMRGFDDSLVPHVAQLPKLKVLKWSSWDLSNQGALGVTEMKSVEELLFDPRDSAFKHVPTFIIKMPQLKRVCPKLKIDVPVAAPIWRENIKRNLEEVTLGLINNAVMLPLVISAFGDSVRILRLHEYRNKMREPLDLVGNFPKCTTVVIRTPKHERMERFIVRGTNIEKLCLYEGLFDLTSIDAVMPNIKHLRLQRVDDSGLAPFVGFKNLESLMMITRYQFTENDIRILFSNCPAIRVIRLHHYHHTPIHVALRELLRVNELRELTEFYISATLSEEDAEEYLTNGILMLPKLQTFGYMLPGLSDNFLRKVRYTSLDIIRVKYFDEGFEDYYD